ncbi:hypothetical protein [Chryseobacterium tongliaoense]|uniref:hypothetical protein n=1 Tax=Chryseobacterium tongliaoense TaxID=3240933 RepID=UPI0035141445
MKKLLLSLLTLYGIFAQVGINTSISSETFDVTAKIPKVMVSNANGAEAWREITSSNVSLTSKMARVGAYCCCCSGIL